MNALVRDLNLPESAVRLRPVLAADEPAVLAFLEGASLMSLHRRFFGATDLARAAASLVGGHGSDDVVLVAQAMSSGEIVAHGASYLTGTDRAEVAFLVTDRWQGRGLGTLLLSRLTQAARKRGVATLVADVLPGNQEMITVFRHSGYPVEVRWDEHRVEVEIDIRARVRELARAA